MDGRCMKYQENIPSQRTPKRTMGRPKGTPTPKWKDDVENGIRKIGIANWIEVAQNRDG
jgi:hypothetical protein